MEKSVNQRVKLLRTSLHLTQEEFSIKVGLSLMGISRLENSDTTPRTSTLSKIVEATGIDKEWLFSGRGEMVFKDVIESEQVPNWKSEAYENLKTRANHLEQEVQFYRSILQNITGKSTTSNFHKAFDLAGFHKKEIVKSVRAVA
jgi:transcriptional regulator with XRE-family HTH domain